MDNWRESRKRSPKETPNSWRARDDRHGKKGFQEKGELHLLKPKNNQWRKIRPIGVAEKKGQKRKKKTQGDGTQFLREISKKTGTEINHGENKDH